MLEEEVNEDYNLARIISLFNGIDSFVLEEHDETEYNIIIYSSSLIRFIKRCNDLNIAFRVDNIYNLSEDVLEDEIANIINNIALQDSIMTAPLSKTKNETILNFKIELHQEEGYEVSCCIYKETKANILIKEVTFNKENMLFTIECLSTFNELKKLTEEKHDYTIIIIQSITVNEEVSELLENLTLYKDETKAYYQNKKEEEERRAFEAVPMEEKRKEVIRLFSELIHSNDSLTQISLYEQMHRYKGMKLWNDSHLKSNLLLRYIYKSNETF